MGLKASWRLELAKKKITELNVKAYMPGSDILSYFCSGKCTLVAVWRRDRLEAER